MSTVRIALANLPFPATPEESVELAIEAIAQASAECARIVRFLECFVPGYRGTGKHLPPPDPVWLERVWPVVATATAKANISVVLGTERAVEMDLCITVLVINSHGSMTAEHCVQNFRSRHQSRVCGLPPAGGPSTAVLLMS